MIEWSPYFEPEFFSISFQLEFDCNSVTISPDRIVNKKFQRNRICSSISLAALKKHTNTQVQKKLTYVALLHVTQLQLSFYTYYTKAKTISTIPQAQAGKIFHKILDAGRSAQSKYSFRSGLTVISIKSEKLINCSYNQPKSFPVLFRKLSIPERFYSPTSQ